ncbi:CapA family protein [Actinacidiphila acididurans]|uniref:CapA family protein n=1 Tax=Actinacidiphila acididurans TaxID=2784346 RepID=A0ABS2U1L8_9ACTN|nr:CapA family protein [Actinacidiphila acididurans]MBM9508942.1 CapA family protein [Actinacidiphila acididurans]
MGATPVTLFLCGDVMLGRGVDQILPSPGDPELHEAYVRDARGYVELAEEAHGRIPRRAGFAWPWGDALRMLERARPDARILNLETGVTRSPDFAPGKAVHYRMNPGNLPSLTVAHPDVCVLSNNHVLDFGPAGLRETLAVLSDVRLRSAGAGPDAEAARRPAVVPLPGGGRLLVFAIGMRSSGIPYEWTATDDHPGIAFVPGPSAAAASCLTDRIRQVKHPGDIVVVSVHWGANWGYDVEGDEVRFARALIDGGADLVHGHSSHHPRPAGIHRGKLVLYGCGDFIDDYEGITGYERYRDDLRAAYLVTLDPSTGRLTGPGARLVLFQAHRMRLRYASGADVEWLRDVLDAQGHDLGVKVEVGEDGSLALRAE